MKIVVASDNHGLPILQKLRERHRDADAFLLCGDSELPPSELDSFVSVRGNNDYFDFPEELVLVLGDHRIFMTHGHRYIYRGSRQGLVQKAKELNCDLVLFGHTHVFEDVQLEGIHLVNPGSCRHNRDWTAASYAILNEENGQFTVTRMNIDF